MRHFNLWSLLLCSVCLAQQIPLGPLAKPTSNDTAQLLSLHRNLIEISSVTGNEQDVGNWLASYLKDHGLTVEKQHLPDGRFNVLAYPGKENITKFLMS